MHRSAPAPLHAPEAVHLRTFLREAIIALALVLFIQTFFLDSRRVVSGSMEPTLLTGDFVFVQNWLYRGEWLGVPLPGWRAPQRGEVATFRLGELVVKRVAGVAGDRVAMRNGQLWRNGRFVEESYARSEADLSIDAPLSPDLAPTRMLGEVRAPEGTFEQWGPVRVPEAHVLLLGDNRDHSFDSRGFGFVPVEHARGRVWVAYFSIAPAESGEPFWERIRWNRIGAAPR